MCMSVYMYIDRLICVLIYLNVMDIFTGMMVLVGLGLEHPRMADQESL